VTAKIISFQEARSRLRGERLMPLPEEDGVDYDAGMRAAWAMLDDGEVGAHEFLELCREAMAEG
jgi:hypothetical protein